MRFYPRGFIPERGLDVLSRATIWDRHLVLHDRIAEVQNRVDANLLAASTRPYRPQ